jgi:glutathione S-transferase
MACTLQGRRFVEVRMSAPVVVYGFGASIWGQPSASPFVNKLVFWLRMVGLPHELRAPTGPPASRTGKVPYIDRPGGAVLADSSVIIATLSAEHGLELGGPLSRSEQARLIALQRLCEDSLYWTVVYFRWLDDGGWAITKPAYFAFLPGLARVLATPFIRRGVVKSLHGQGLGRRSPAEVAAVGIANLDALEALLGDQDYFLGRPTLADAIVWGFLAGYYATPYSDPVTAHARRSGPLRAFVERMGTRWPGP